MTGLNPITFSTIGGISITITGTNFGTTNSVVSATFGPVPSSSCVWINDEAMECISPAGTGSTLILDVTVGGQTSFSAASFIAVKEAEENVRSIQAQSMPRVESSATISGISRNTFLTPASDGQSLSDLFKHGVATALDVGIGDVVIANITEVQSAGRRLRRILATASLVIQFAVTVNNEADAADMLSSWPISKSNMASAVMFASYVLRNLQEPIGLAPSNTWFRFTNNVVCR